MRFVREGAYGIALMEISWNYLPDKLFRVVVAMRNMKV